MKATIIQPDQAICFEDDACGLVGVDEVGRGPLAGPVVASAVILTPDNPGEGLTDSKQLSPRRRESWCDWIKQNAAAWAVSFIDPHQIDTMNIFQASLLAMQQAVQQLPWDLIQHIVVDGRHVPSWDYPSTAVVKGDARVSAISAASILAKVARDQYMVACDDQFPEYGFAQHKGYPTKVHQQALAEHGPCAIHRRSFSPVQRHVKAYE